MATRVLLADDHPVYLDGLAAAIGRAGDLDLVATCSDGAQALERLRAEPPDVAVLDLSMPRMGARGILEELAGEGLPCPVLVLSVIWRPGGARLPQPRRDGLRRQGRRPGRDLRRDPRVAAGRTVVSGEALTGMSAELQHRRTAEHGLLTAA